MRIAALDDEPSQLELIRHTMEGLDHECHGFAEGRGLLRALRQETFDLLIIDWSLPDMTGPAVVRVIRQEMLSRIPILFVTNRREEADMVEGLGIGADDFMAKPIRVGELAARTQALLRRAYPSHHDMEVVHGPYHFHPHARTLHVNGEPLDLKHREYELALFLFQNMGRLLSRDHLREAIWGQAQDAASRSLDTHISRLRAKLDLRPSNGVLLCAIYGLGYRLEAVESETSADAASADTLGANA